MAHARLSLPEPRPSYAPAWYVPYSAVPGPVPPIAGRRRSGVANRLPSGFPDIIDC